MKRLVGLGSVLGVALALAPAAHASLVLQSLVPLTGTGLGTEPTILTIQNNATTEAGCVSFTNLGQSGFTANATGACIGSSSDVSTGASQTSLQPLSAVGTGGITASNFGVVFNADQSAGGGITLTSLNVAFYNTAGTLLFQSGPVTCTAAGLTNCAFASTVHGIGGAGYLFQLDGAQQAAATAAHVFDTQTTIVGLSASVSGNTGGGETFFLARVPGISTVPEPASMLLMGAGLIGLAFVRKRRSVN